MDNIKYIDSSGLGTLVAAQRENPGCIAAPVPSRQQVPGSAADHQPADGIRGLRYGSSRCRQFLKVSAISAPENSARSLVFIGRDSTSRFGVDWRVRESVALPAQNRLYFHEISAHTSVSKLSEPLELVAGLPRQVFT
jgi:hypothetical protein